MNSTDDCFAVILAGGSGTRFWPKSRHLSPKQLCTIGDGQASMIEITLNRLQGFIPKERCLVVTHADQVAKTKELVSSQCDHFIAEPEAKNTAAALCAAAYEIKALTGKNPTMICLHADHVIADEGAFIDSLQRSVSIAQDGMIALLGIVPKHPETGYGYIERGSPLAPRSFSVKGFKEKPDLPTAKAYLASGGYYWNAGMFIWQVDTFLNEVGQYLPACRQTFEEATKSGTIRPSQTEPSKWQETYGKLESISVDHAILEKSQKCAVVEADIGWQDVGSWDSLAECFTTDDQGNLPYGDVLLIDTVKTTVDTDGPFVAAVGLKDMVVVCAKGAVLVCPADRAQDVKRIVTTLKEQGRQELL